MSLGVLGDLCAERYVKLSLFIARAREYPLEPYTLFFWVGKDPQGI